MSIRSSSPFTFSALIGPAFFLFTATVIGCTPQQSMLEMPPSSRPVLPINAPLSITQQMYGVRGDGTRASGAMINSIVADFGQLAGLDLSNGQIVRGADWVGAQIPVRDRSGNTTMARITDWAAEKDADRFVIKLPSGAPICGSLAGVPIWAYPIPNVYDLETGRERADSSLYTLACFGGAIMECIHHGYRPWEQREEWNADHTAKKFRDLSPYHAACMAMLRGDYCGDGTTHAYSDVSVEISDNLFFNTSTVLGTSDPQAGALSREAEWAADGAWCIEHTRFMQSDGMTLADNQDGARNPHWQYIVSHCPWRIAGMPGASSGNTTPRPCGAQSSYLVENGFHLTDQTIRSMLVNTSPLYRELPSNP